MPCSKYLIHVSPPLLDCKLLQDFFSNYLLQCLRCNAWAKYSVNDWKRIPLSTKYFEIAKSLKNVFILSNVSNRSLPTCQLASLEGKRKITKCQAWRNTPQFCFFFTVLNALSTWEIVIHWDHSQFQLWVCGGKASKKLNLAKKLYQEKMFRAANKLRVFL